MHINDVGQGSREEVDVGPSGPTTAGTAGRARSPTPPSAAAAPSRGHRADPRLRLVHRLPFDHRRRLHPRRGLVVRPTTAATCSPTSAAARSSCSTAATSGTSPPAWASAVHMEFGPDRSLYYTNYAGGGEVRRISFAAPLQATSTGTAPATSGCSAAGFRAWLVRGSVHVSWGLPGDLPVAADYDGDGTVDPAVFRPSSSQWFIRDQATISGNRRRHPGSCRLRRQWDGRDSGVDAPEGGAWFVQGRPVVNWGQPGDIPVPADYDGTERPTSPCGGLPQEGGSSRAGRWSLECRETSQFRPTTTATEPPIWRCGGPR